MAPDRSSTLAAPGRLRSLPSASGARALDAHAQGRPGRSQAGERALAGAACQGPAAAERAAEAKRQWLLQRLAELSDVTPGRPCHGEDSDRDAVFRTPEDERAG